jgi:hypothetical protein
MVSSSSYQAGADMKEILDRLDRMDAGFQRLERKLDADFQRLDNKMDAGFHRLDNKMDASFQKQGVQLEALQSDVKQALEGISGNRKVLDDQFAEVLQKFDERVQPVELASRHVAQALAAATPLVRVKRKKQGR